METHDDELIRFEAEGAAPLPETEEQGYVEHDNARIWYAAYGSGRPVILLHSGLGNSGNWGYQVPALIANGYPRSLSTAAVTAAARVTSVPMLMS